MLCLIFAAPTSFVGAQDSRHIQVWPDHNVGVASGLLANSTTHVATEILPLGAHRLSNDDAVYARTYLQFPLDVFPPGTEIMRATLHVYVDVSSSAGEATFGVYRVLDSWEGAGVDWDSDPDTWPKLLDSPLSNATVHFDVVTPTLPLSFTIPTTATGPSATPTATPLPATPTPTTTSTPPTSPLSTPTLSPPSPTRTPPPQPLSLPVVPLGQASGTWLTWDITALMRAWYAGEAPNDGLALASAPDPNAVPEEIEDLLVARWIAAADSDTMPHVIVEFDVHPVTPTQPASPLPTPSPVPVLPVAGSAAGWWSMGAWLIGVALLVLGLGLVKNRQ